MPKINSQISISMANDKSIMGHLLKDSGVNIPNAFEVNASILKRSDQIEKLKKFLLLSKIWNCSKTFRWFSR